MTSAAQQRIGQKTIAAMKAQVDDSQPFPRTADCEWISTTYLYQEFFKTATTQP